MAKEIISLTQESVNVLKERFAALSRQVPKSRATTTVVLWTKNNKLYVYCSSPTVYGWTSGVECSGWANSPYYEVYRDMYAQLIQILDGDVTMEFDAGIIKFISKDGKFSLRANQTSKPNLSVEKPEITYTLSKEDQQNLRVVRDAVENNKEMIEARPVFAAVAVKAEGNNLYLYGTNSHILGYQELELNTPVQEKKFFLTQPAVWNAPVGENGIRIAFTKAQTIVTGDINLVYSNIEGTAPNYDGVLTNTFETKVVFDKDDFVSAMKRLAIVTSFEPMAPVELHFSKDSVYMFTETKTSDGLKDIGAVNTRISFEIANGSPEGQKVAYLYENLKKAMNASGDKVILNLQTQKGNISLLPAKFDSGEKGLLIVTPIRKNEWAKVED